MARQLLLIAEPLLAEGIRAVLASSSQLSVETASTALSGSPQLVIWCPEQGITASSLLHESQRLHDVWAPSPLLLVLPQTIGLSRDRLLALPAEGLLQAPDASTLADAVESLLQGGRCVHLDASGAETTPAALAPTLGLGQWLLISGLQQIDRDLALCEALLASQPEPLLLVLVLQGRCRELRSARSLLLTLWGPLSIAWGAELEPPPPKAAAAATPAPATALQLSLSQRNAEGSWQAISARLEQSFASGLHNRSGQLLALEGLHPDRRLDLLRALLEQLQLLRHQLADSSEQPRQLGEHWSTVQQELRQSALRRMASPYVRLPLAGALQPVAETLIRDCALDQGDPESPDPQAMLQALVLGQPLLIDGQLVPADAPLAVLHLEKLVANWLLRNAELISGQVLGCCAAWPELRRYLLVPELLSTRQLERLRNQLNAQQRWASWLQRPIAIYESRRPLLTIDSTGIHCQQLTEPRDQELRQLSWGQQLVTLLLESRDALAPQVQGLIQALGKLLVIVLTRVVGRAIGLVGRGIVQGMGRGLQH